MRELVFDLKLTHDSDGRTELKVTDRESGIVLFVADMNGKEARDFMIGGTVNSGRGVFVKANDSEKLARVGQVRWNASLNLAAQFDGDERGAASRGDVRLQNLIESDGLTDLFKGYAYHRVDRKNYGLSWIVYGYSADAASAVTDARAAAKQLEELAISGEWQRPNRRGVVESGDADFYPANEADITARDW